ncbi:putative meiosis-specific protein SPO11 [Spraguea lophii 42_110]|uniref:DNA topoisomerase (ATP-hydrolyzing) n=1 Tax=Spraguea lophii (strain 42_110) TaxID=1358809 RepID=S7WDQ2_SPRLO|nr:putative meiosis-specific protein SPO11 [Spraguea lophii 42_110]
MHKNMKNTLYSFMKSSTKEKDNIREKNIKNISFKENCNLSKNKCKIEENEEYILNIIDLEFKIIVKKPYKPGFVRKLKFLSLIKEMKLHNIKRTKREFFYTAVNVFETQNISDYYINAFLKKYKISTQDINISASLKGLFYGEVKFVGKDGTKILNEGVIPDVEKYDIFTKYNNILVLEKDSLLTFIKDNFKKSYTNNILFVTGKGYPCHNTIKFLQKLQHKIIYGIFDLDPFGINIYRTYRNKVNIKRIGITSKDIFKYEINKNELIDIKPIDRKILENIIKIEDEKEIIDDLKFIQGMDKKMEVEIFNNDINFLIKFIEDKIR